MYESHGYSPTDEVEVFESEGEGVIHFRESADLLPGVEAMRTRKKDQVIGPIEFHPTKKGVLLFGGMIFFGFWFLFFVTRFLGNVSADSLRYSSFVAVFTEPTPFKVIIAEFIASVLFLGGTLGIGYSYRKNGGANMFFKVGFHSIGELSAAERKAWSIQGFDNKQHSMALYIESLERAIANYRWKGIVGVSLFGIGGVLAATLPNIGGGSFLTIIGIIIGVVGISGVFDWRINEANLLSIFYFRKIRSRSIYERIICEEAMLLQLEDAEALWKHQEALKDKNPKRSQKKEELKRQIDQLRLQRGMSEQEVQIQRREEDLSKMDIDDQLEAMLSDLKNRPKDEPDTELPMPEEPMGGDVTNTVIGSVDDYSEPDRKQSKNAAISEDDFSDLENDLPPEEEGPTWDDNYSDESIRVDGNSDEDWEYWQKYYHK